MYLINLLAEKIKSFRANESKSHTDLYARGYIHAMEELELSPTKETYNRLMVEQDDQVNRNDFDRGIKAYLDQYEFKKDKEMNIYYENIQWEEKLSASIHPAWHNCNEWARGMHMRNVHQILGYNLDYPVDAVVTWVKEDAYGNPKGGTATAIKLAREYGIPVFNLNTPDVQKVLYEIKDWLEVNNT